MYCLVKDGPITYGPAPWDFRALLEQLIVSGFDLLDGVLYQREGEELHRVCDFPDVEPQGPLALPGFMILPVVEVDEPAPEGKLMSGREPVLMEDRVEVRPIWADIPIETPPSLDEVKASRCANVDALRDTKLRAGFTFDRDGRHVLQTRGDDDRLNWLGVLSGCQALVTAGQGSAPLSIRTEANETLSVPAAELMAILLGALNHQSAIYAAAWVHKDAINTITEESGGREAVQAHDITTGWPA